MDRTEHVATVQPLRPKMIGLATIRREYFSDEISDSMLRKEIKSGRLPCVRIGRRVFVRETDLQAYLAR